MIKWIIAPIVGGVIGYITNDLAIRMLFRPRNEVYIGKFHVPFTPGLIPKQKGRIAQSIGSVISTQLLNEDTLRDTLLSEKTIQTLQAKVQEFIHDLALDTRPLIEVLGTHFGRENVEEKSKALEETLAEVICQRIREGKIGQAIVDSVAGSWFEMLGQNKLLTMVLDHKAQEMLKAKLAAAVDGLIADKVPDVVYRMIDDTRRDILKTRVCDLYERYRDKEDDLIRQGTELYTNVLGDNVGKLLQAVNIEQIVVNKINAFDAAQLEEMIFGIMKRELNAIVYLGAALGFLMGFVNVLF